MLDRLPSCLVCLILECSNLPTVLAIRSTSKLIHQCANSTIQFTDKIPVGLEEILRLYNQSIGLDKDQVVDDINRFPIQSLQGFCNFEFDLFYNNPGRHIELFRSILLNAQTIKVLHVPNRPSFDLCIRLCSNQLIQLTLSNRSEPNGAGHDLINQWISSSDDKIYFSKLKRFTLCQNESFDDKTLQWIVESMPSLSDVRLNLESSRSTCRLDMFMSQLPNLTSLHLTAYNHVHATTSVDEWLSHLAPTTCQQLQRLSLSECQQIDQYARLLNLTSLEGLSMEYSTNSNQAREHLERTLTVLMDHPTLSHLHLRLCKAINLADCALLALARMRSLTSLTIDFPCAQGVPPLLQTLVQIKQLNLHFQPVDVNDNLIVNLVDCLPRPNLQDVGIYIYMSGYINTIPPSIGHVLKAKSIGHFPRLRYIDYNWIHKFFL